MSDEPPCKRARTLPPHERALQLLKAELDHGRTLEDAVAAVTAGDDGLRDAALACVRTTPALRDAIPSLAALLAPAPLANEPPPAPPQAVPESDNATPDEEHEVDAEAAAMHATLRAAMARGLSLEAAISASLGGRSRLVSPVMAALRAAPYLREDLGSVAALCEAVRDASTIPTRPRLSLSLTNFTDVGALIARSHRIVVLAGAGVSVSCGIPDFRSAGGLYETVAQRFGVPDPQAIFDLAEFRLDPALFYAFAREIMPRPDVAPSPTHRFVAELARRGRLLRVYTQNIDGLEHRAGVPADRLVACHGDFNTATCQRCGRGYGQHVFGPDILAGKMPTCPRCGALDFDDDDGLDEARARAVLKPDIVFFGEQLPSRVNDCLQKDLHQADLLLVLGTSLMVAPVARIPEFFPPHLPRVLVNRELVDYRFDVELLGNCDAVVAKLRAQLGWCEWECGKEEKVPFVPPRRFIFEGSKVAADEPVEDDDGFSLFEVLNAREEAPSSGEEDAGCTVPAGDGTKVESTGEAADDGKLEATFD